VLVLVLLLEGMVLVLVVVGMVLVLLVVLLLVAVVVAVLVVRWWRLCICSLLITVLGATYAVTTCGVLCPSSTFP